MSMPTRNAANRQANTAISVSPDAGETEVAKKPAKTQRMLQFDLRRPDIIPASLFPSLRVRISLETRDPKEAKKRRDALETLVEKREWSLLSAIQRRELDVAEVALQIKREGEVAAIPNLLKTLAAKNVEPVPTFKEQKELYLASYADLKSPESLKDVRSRLNRIGRQKVAGRNGTLTDQAIEDQAIDQLHALHFEDALRRLATNANSYESLRHALSGMYRWSIGQEKQRAEVSKTDPRWSANPAKSVSKRETSGRVTILKDIQFGALYAVAELYQKAYLLWFFCMGFRSGEFRHLRLGIDLDIDDGWLVTIDKHPPDPRCTCPQCKKDGWKPKSKASYRSFRVPHQRDQLRRMLEMYFEVYPAAPGDFVFRNPRTGRIWSARALEDDFKRLCGAAGIRYGRSDGVTLHTLRHTCATNMLRAGVGLKHVADLIGDTAKTVAATYAHLDPEDLTSGLEVGMRYLNEDARAARLRLVS